MLREQFVGKRTENGLFKGANVQPVPYRGGIVHPSSLIYLEPFRPRSVELIRSNISTVSHVSHQWSCIVYPLAIHNYHYAKRNFHEWKRTGESISCQLIVILSPGLALATLAAGFALRPQVIASLLAPLIGSTEAICRMILGGGS